MASFVGPGESIADIGADHGYLPLWLVREGISPFAVLTDVQPGPLEKCRASVEKNLGLVSPEDSGIELRLGDGLAVLKSGEVDVIVIAGMGAETIVSILAADTGKARSFGKFILQPRTKTDVLLKWIRDNGWEILSETVAPEKGRLCDIIACRPGGNYDD